MDKEIIQDSIFSKAEFKVEMSLGYAQKDFVEKIKVNNKQKIKKYKVF